MTKLTPQDRRILHDALSDSPQFRTVRGRDTLVRNAISGYPNAANVEKALRWVDWEGSPFVVADDLLHHIETADAAPGIPVLALLAQAIEPMSGEHRPKLADLRRRHKWGAIDPALTSEPWHDHRPPSDLIRERIIGENTLKPMYYLRRALEAADAVVRVDLQGQPKGTGFLIAPNLMVTNHHVIGTQEEAQAASACFFNEVPDSQSKLPARKEITISTASDQPLLYTNPTLDISVLRLNDAPQLRRYLPLRQTPIERDDRVVIIQHPGGYPKQIAIQNNLIAFADTRLVQYYTSTKAGSSGAPVLDDNFALVAVHHGWAHNADWDGNGKIRDPKDPEDLQYRNQGTSVIAWLEDLRKHAPQLIAELPR